MPEVTALLPDANESSVFLTDPISATFDKTMNAAEATSFVAHGAFTGKLTGTYSGAGTATLSFSPSAGFKAGEEIEVTLTDALSSTAGRPAIPFVYRFRAEVLSGSGVLISADSVDSQNDVRGVVAGDWDADGDLDLAAANFGANSVTILRNNGNGSFSTVQTLTSLQGASAVVAGDWDADGYLDLSVASFSSNSVTILRNNGNGSFSTVQTVPGLQGASAVVAGDWDADGDLDLAVANFGANSVTLLRNNDSGSFSTVQTIFPLSGARALAAGDWNGDGDLDLASANSGSNTVGILQNQP